MDPLSFFFNRIVLFIFFFNIFFWLCWVFVSVRGPSPVAASGGHSSSRCAGLSPSRPLPLRSTGSRRAGSAAVAHGPSCSVARGIFPDQGSNPCPPHWRADSQPLRHKGSPTFFLFNKFTYLFLAALGLRCCEWAFSSCGERRLLFVVVRGLLISHCSGFSCCGAQAPGARASVVAARGLSSCGSRALECRLSSCGAQA